MPAQCIWKLSDRQDLTDERNDVRTAFFVGKIMMQKQFHLSEKYLSRYFKQHFHLTLTQYLMHLRLTHACHLLESTSLPVTEVALQSGFSNVSHFIRSFHASFRMSPLQYRKKRDQSFT